MLENGAWAYDHPKRFVSEFLDAGSNECILKLPASSPEKPPVTKQFPLDFKLLHAK